MITRIKPLGGGLRMTALVAVLAGLAVPAGAAARRDSGIAGDVKLGPTCPVLRPGSPGCADRPYAATIEIWRRGHLLRRVHSAKNGRFRVGLAPATYLLVPRSPHHRRLPHGQPLTVTVTRHRFVHVSIFFDSGIR